MDAVPSEIYTPTDCRKTKSAEYAENVANNGALYDNVSMTSEMKKASTAGMIAHLNCVVFCFRKINYIYIYIYLPIHYVSIRFPNYFH